MAGSKNTNNINYHFVVTANTKGMENSLNGVSDAVIKLKDEAEKVSFKGLNLTDIKSVGNALGQVKDEVDRAFSKLPKLSDTFVDKQLPTVRRLLGAEQQLAAHYKAIGGGDVQTHNIDASKIKSKQDLAGVGDIKKTLEVFSGEAKELGSGSYNIISAGKQAGKDIAEGGKEAAKIIGEAGKKLGDSLKVTYGGKSSDQIISKDAQTGAAKANSGEFVIVGKDTVPTLKSGHRYSDINDVRKIADAAGALEKAAEKLERSKDIDKALANYSDASKNFMNVWRELDLKHFGEIHDIRQSWKDLLPKDVVNSFKYSQENVNQGSPRSTEGHGKADLFEGLSTATNMKRVFDRVIQDADESIKSTYKQNVRGMFAPPNDSEYKSKTLESEVAKLFMSRGFNVKDDHSIQMAIIELTRAIHNVNALTPKFDMGKFIEYNKVPEKQEDFANFVRSFIKSSNDIVSSQYKDVIDAMKKEYKERAAKHNQPTEGDDESKPRRRSKSDPNVPVTETVGVGVKVTPNLSSLQDTYNFIVDYFATHRVPLQFLHNNEHFQELLRQVRSEQAGIIKEAVGMSPTDKTYPKILRNLVLSNNSIEEARSAALGSLMGQMAGSKSIDKDTRDAIKSGEVSLEKALEMMLSRPGTRLFNTATIVQNMTEDMRKELRGKILEAEVGLKVKSELPEDVVKNMRTKILDYFKAMPPIDVPLGFVSLNREIDNLFKNLSKLNTLDTITIGEFSTKQVEKLNNITRYLEGLKNNATAAKDAMEALKAKFDIRYNKENVAAVNNSLSELVDKLNNIAKEPIKLTVTINDTNVKNWIADFNKQVLELRRTVKSLFDLGYTEKQIPKLSSQVFGIGDVEKATKQLEDLKNARDKAKNMFVPESFKTEPNKAVSDMSNVKGITIPVRFNMDEQTSSKIEEVVTKLKSLSDRLKENPMLVYFKGDESSFDKILNRITELNLYRTDIAGRPIIVHFKAEVDDQIKKTIDDINTKRLQIQNEPIQVSFVSGKNDKWASISRKISYINQIRGEFIKPENAIPVNFTNSKTAENTVNMLNGNPQVKPVVELTDFKEQIDAARKYVKEQLTNHRQTKKLNIKATIVNAKDIIKQLNAITNSPGGYVVEFYPKMVHEALNKVDKLLKDNIPKSIDVYVNAYLSPFALANLQKTITDKLNSIKIEPINQDALTKFDTLKTKITETKELLEKKLTAHISVRDARNSLQSLQNKYRSFTHSRGLNAKRPLILNITNLDRMISSIENLRNILNNTGGNQFANMFNMLNQASADAGKIVTEYLKAVGSAGGILLKPDTAKWDEFLKKYVGNNATHPLSVFLRVEVSKRQIQRAIGKIKNYITNGPGHGAGYQPPTVYLRVSNSVENLGGAIATLRRNIKQITKNDNIDIKTNVPGVDWADSIVYSLGNNLAKLKDIAKGQIKLVIDYSDATHALTVIKDLIDSIKKLPATNIKVLFGQSAVTSYNSGKKPRNNPITRNMTLEEQLKRWNRVADYAYQKAQNATDPLQAERYMQRFNRLADIVGQKIQEIVDKESKLGTSSPGKLANMLSNIASTLDKDTVGFQKLTEEARKFVELQNQMNAIVRRGAVWDPATGTVTGNPNRSTNNSIRSTSGLPGLMGDVTEQVAYITRFMGRSSKGIGSMFEAISQLMVDLKSSSEIIRNDLASGNTVLGFSSIRADAFAATARFLTGLTAVADLLGAVYSVGQMLVNSWQSMYQILQQVYQTIKQILQSGIELYEQRQSALFSLTASIMSNTKVDGQPVSEREDATEFSMGMASKLIDQMALDAELSAFTLKDLLSAMQGTLPMFLNLGMSVEQAYDIVKGVAAVAKMIRLNPSQILQEARDLAQGSITPRGSQVANAIGLTNQDLQGKNAEERYNLIIERVKNFHGLLEDFEDTAIGRYEQFQERWARATLEIVNGLAPFVKGVSEALIDMTGRYVSSMGYYLDAMTREWKDDKGNVVATVDEAAKGKVNIGEVSFELSEPLQIFRDVLIDVIKYIAELADGFVDFISNGHSMEETVAKISSYFKLFIDIFVMVSRLIVYFFDAIVAFEQPIMVVITILKYTLNLIKAVFASLYSIYTGVQVLLATIIKWLDYIPATFGNEKHRDTFIKEREDMDKVISHIRENQYKNAENMWKNIDWTPMTSYSDLGTSDRKKGNIYNAVTKYEGQVVDGSDKAKPNDTQLKQLEGINRKNQADLAKELKKAIQSQQKVLKNAIASLKGVLDASLAKLKEIREQNELDFKQGLKPMSDYYADKAALDKEEHTQRLQELMYQKELLMQTPFESQYEAIKEAFSLDKEIRTEQREIQKATKGQNDVLRLTGKITTVQSNLDSNMRTTADYFKKVTKESELLAQKQEALMNKGVTTFNSISTDMGKAQGSASSIAQSLGMASDAVRKMVEDVSRTSISSRVPNYGSGANNTSNGELGLDPRVLSHIYNVISNSEKFNGDEISESQKEVVAAIVAGSNSSHSKYNDIITAIKLATVTFETGINSGLVGHDSEGNSFVGIGQFMPSTAEALSNQYNNGVQLDPAKLADSIKLMNFYYDDIIESLEAKGFTPDTDPEFWHKVVMSYLGGIGGAEEVGFDYKRWNEFDRNDVARRVQLAQNMLPELSSYSLSKSIEDNTNAVEDNTDSTNNNTSSTNENTQATSETGKGLGWVASGHTYNGHDTHGIDTRFSDLQQLSQSNWDTLGNMHEETVRAINEMAKRYFEQTGKKLIISSITGGKHLSNGSPTGHSAGWKYDVSGYSDMDVVGKIAKAMGLGAGHEFIGTDNEHMDISVNIGGVGGKVISAPEGKWLEALKSGVPLIAGGASGTGVDWSKAFKADDEAFRKAQEAQNARIELERNLIKEIKEYGSVLKFVPSGRFDEIMTAPMESDSGFELRNKILEQLVEQLKKLREDKSVFIDTSEIDNAIDKVEKFQKDIKARQSMFPQDALNANELELQREQRNRKKADLEKQWDYIQKMIDTDITRAFNEAFLGNINPKFSPSNVLQRYTKYFYDDVDNPIAPAHIISKMWDLALEYQAHGDVDIAQDIRDKILSFYDMLNQKFDEYIGKIGDLFSNYQTWASNSWLTNLQKARGEREIQAREGQIKAREIGTAYNLVNEQLVASEHRDKDLFDEAVWLQGQLAEATTEAQKQDVQWAIDQQAEDRKKNALLTDRLKLRKEELAVQKLLAEQESKVNDYILRTQQVSKQALEDGLVTFLTDGVNEAESLGDALRDLAVNYLKTMQKYFAEEMVTSMMTQWFPAMRKEYMPEGQDQTRLGGYYDEFSARILYDKKFGNGQSDQFDFDEAAEKYYKEYYSTPSNDEILDKMSEEERKKFLRQTLVDDAKLEEYKMGIQSDQHIANMDTTLTQILEQLKTDKVTNKPDPGDGETRELKDAYTQVDKDGHSIKESKVTEIARVDTGVKIPEENNAIPEVELQAAQTQQAAATTASIAATTNQANVDKETENAVKQDGAATKMDNAANEMQNVSKETASDMVQPMTYQKQKGALQSQQYTPKSFGGVDPSKQGFSLSGMFGNNFMQSLGTLFSIKTLFSGDTKEKLLSMVYIQLQLIWNQVMMLSTNVFSMLTLLTSWFNRYLYDMQMQQYSNQTPQFVAKGDIIHAATGYAPDTQGGMVKGPGTSTSDSIPAMLSNGEAVLNAKAVRRLGTNFVNNVNNGNFTKIKTSIPHFADGGIIGDAQQNTARGMTDFASSMGKNVSVNNNMSIALVRDESEALNAWAKSPSGGQKFLVDFMKGNARVFSRF